MPATEGAAPHLGDRTWDESTVATPLHYAALLGSTPLATLLADRGADRSLKDGDGNTAADVARSEGHSEIAELLARATPK